jgi:hypothetical protein
LSLLSSLSPIVPRGTGHMHRLLLFFAYCNIFSCNTVVVLKRDDDGACGGWMGHKINTAPLRPTEHNHHAAVDDGALDDNIMSRGFPFIGLLSKWK